MSAASHYLCGILEEEGLVWPSLDDEMSKRGIVALRWSAKVEEGVLKWLAVKGDGLVAFVRACDGNPAHSLHARAATDAACRMNQRLTTVFLLPQSTSGRLV